MRSFSLALILFSAGTAVAADPWADRVVSYNAAGGIPTYGDPAAALGSPTRFTGVQFGFPSAVTPFSPPFDPGDIVDIGRGGWLTVAFDEAVTNDGANPFGMDLLVFGNAFLIDSDYPHGHAIDRFGSAGSLEVSADGVDWHAVTSGAMSGLFPTLGYSDLTDPYSTTPGAVFSDFTRPVDPGFDPVGKDFAQIVAGYNGSGGGLGIDIGALGLSSVSYVRVTAAAGGVAIDGFADVSAVPSPASAAVLAALVGVRRRRS